MAAPPIIINLNPAVEGAAAATVAGAALVAAGDALAGDVLAGDVLAGDAFGLLGASPLVIFAQCCCTLDGVRPVPLRRTQRRQTRDAISAGYAARGDW